MATAPRPSSSRTQVVMKSARLPRSSSSSSPSSGSLRKAKLVLRMHSPAGWRARGEEDDYDDGDEDGNDNENGTDYFEEDRIIIVK